MREDSQPLAEKTITEFSGDARPDGQKGVFNRTAARYRF